VATQIKISSLFKLNDKLPYEDQLQKTIDLIGQGSKILSLWYKLYKDTKLKIEEEGLERWDFPVPALNSRIEHMNGVLNDLAKISDVMKRFLVFLGPNLKAVTGNSEGIDNLVEEVKKLVFPFENSEIDFFQKAHVHFWSNLINKFRSERKIIEENAIKLIHETFRDLRSAEGAFDLLQKFKNVTTVEAISNNLQMKYSEVLKRYTKEVENNKLLFERGRSYLQRTEVAERKFIDK